MGGFGIAFRHWLDFVADEGSTLQAIGVCLLALVFALSSIPKIRRPDLAALALVQFGITPRVRPTLGLLLGTGEGCLSVTLIASLFDNALLPVAGAAATVLCWVFVALIAVHLAAGRKFTCYCFGDTEDVLSVTMLARTTALAVLASTLLLGLSPTTPSDIDALVLAAVSAASVVGSYVLASAVPRLFQATTPSSRPTRHTRHEEAL